MTPRHLLFAAPLLILLLLTAGATAQAPAGHHEVQLSILQHHPYPDPGSDGERDPLGFPAVNTSDGGRDWMHATYGATWFPTVRVDGVREHANPRGGNVTDPHPVYEDMVTERLDQGSPAILRLDLTRSGGNLTVDATAVMRTSLATDKLVLRLVVFEDPVHHAGGNGITEHRFTTRAVLQGAEVPTEEGRGAHVTRNLTLDPAWTSENLGAVAYLQNLDDRQALDHLEVVQSATHKLTWPNATVQVEKAPLLELYTATWCPPCAPADRAVDRLATTYGVAATGQGDPWRYLSAPTIPQAGLALLGTLVLAAVLVPRRGGRDP